MQLRAARQLARKLFDMADDDSSGFLDKDEVIQVERRLVQRCPEVELVPPFDPDKDFSVMDKDGHGFVSWSEFEGTHAGVSRPPARPPAIRTQPAHRCGVRGVCLGRLQTGG